MKTKEEIFVALKDVMVEMFELDPDEITLEANLYSDLDVDSIDAVDLVVRLREWTSEKITPEEFKNVQTVSDVVDAIEDLLARAS